MDEKTIDRLYREQSATTDGTGRTAQHAVEADKDYKRDCEAKREARS
ncbi:hypothetical protein K1W69_24635 [Hoeflea sp. WL0058]|uniref:Uncharacterized protein n=1 Tax=Flavimaribacter sediminis TaxID=2865987 RepID=A0AAE3D3T1_9HYPH|nr:hypothetical protein [Flavimaribacter sediminis]MBW8640402.1 hypothetical protein [Flavimaribacter sediminis]